MLNDLPLAVSAARAAGEILRGAFRSEGPVEYKTPDQPVTEADRAADRFLREFLLRDRAGYGWISEESDDTPGAMDRTWVVDPLDGTWNFVEGRPEFAICIGLIERGTPVLGVVYNPVTETLYEAARGSGARRNGGAIRARASNPRRPVLVASADELARGRLSGLNDLAEVVTLGSTALKVTRVAEGGADLYVSRSRKELWDLCAPGVIAAEAGAKLETLDGDPVEISPGAGPWTGLVVTAPGTENIAAHVRERLSRGKTPADKEGER